MSGLPSPTGFTQTTGLSTGLGFSLGYGLAFQGFATQQTIYDRFNATVFDRASATILQRY